MLPLLRVNSLASTTVNKANNFDLPLCNKERLVRFLFLFHTILAYINVLFVILGSMQLILQMHVIIIYMHYSYKNLSVGVNAAVVKTCGNLLMRI